mgnify:CR=1 FL=1
MVLRKSGRVDSRRFSQVERLKRKKGINRKVGSFFGYTDVTEAYEAA